MVAPRARGRERGVALIAVLWVGVVMAALAAAVVALGRGDLDLAHSQRARAEAELAADSAARTAIYAMINPVESANAADGSVAAWRLAGAEVRVEITPEHGRLDLNHADPELVAALLRAGGADADTAASLAAAIADFVDGNDDPGPLGAEQPAYAAAGLPGPKNAPLEHPDELLGVLGMPGALYRRIADAVTVHTGRPAPQPGWEHPLLRTAPGGQPDAGPLPAAFAVELDAVPRQLRPGDIQAGGDLVRVRAEAVTEAGARAARVAVVELRSRAGAPYGLRAWRTARPRLFPD